MAVNQGWKLLYMAIVLSGLSSKVIAEKIEHPCSGPTALLGIIDRPADSACVVPFKKVLLESGYQYLQLLKDEGTQQNFPEAKFRLGLPQDTEFVVIIPNYFHQSIKEPFSGFGPTSLGIKHEFGYTKHWLFTVEGLVTPKSGSNAFGAAETGGAVNPIFGYTHGNFNATFILGLSTQTQSPVDGGQRFSSFNPDLVVTYFWKDKYSFFGEIYGQTNIGPEQGSSSFVNVGLIYLLFPNVTIDLEAGRRLSGMLNNFEYFFGTGLTAMLG